MLNKVQLFFVAMFVSYPVWAENVVHSVPVNRDIVIEGVAEDMNANTGKVGIQGTSTVSDMDIKVPDNSPSVQPHQEATPRSSDEIGFHIYEIPDNPIWMQPDNKNNAVIIYNYNAAKSDDKGTLRLPTKKERKRISKRIKRKSLEVNY